MLYYTIIPNSTSNRIIDFEILRRHNSRKVMFIKFLSITDKYWVMNCMKGRPEILNIESMDDKNSYETVHSSFCKFVLGLSKFSSNVAVLGELGRFPLDHKVKIAHILYWHRLVCNDQDQLLNSAFQDCLRDRHDFIKSVESWLHKVGCSYILNNPSCYSAQYIKCTINQKMKDQYVQYYDANVNERFENLKLSSRDTYCHSPYLDKIKNVGIRNIVTRFRLNCNKLKEYSHKQDKDCIKCKSTENVKHALLHCTKDNLLQTRTKFFNDMCRYEETFRHLNDNLKMYKILNVEFKNAEADRICCKFLKDMYNNINANIKILDQDTHV